MNEKASVIAQELRRIADALDKEPDAEIHHTFPSFDTDADKDAFLRLARVWPRPAKKEITWPEESYSALNLIHGNARLSIKRSSLCTLVKPAQPAVYDCEPILSKFEEDSLVEAE